MGYLDDVNASNLQKIALELTNITRLLTDLTHMEEVRLGVRTIQEYMEDKEV